MSTSSSLQYLHQNLHQLKYSKVDLIIFLYKQKANLISKNKFASFTFKLMENRRFKQLYEEAKGHEKHANLTNLSTRVKK